LLFSLRRWRVSTFLLVVAAIAGTLLLILNPTRRLIKLMDGKKSSELQVQFKEYLDNAPAEQVVASGCKWGCFISLSLLFTFVVEPIVILSAISEQVGNQPIAYVMLFIVAVAWIQSIYSIFFKKKTTGQGGTIVTTDGREVQGTIVGVDEEIHLGNPYVRTIRTAVYSLPTLYLWYLFGIAIRIIPS
jgi:hypothetical protein